MYIHAAGLSSDMIAHDALIIVGRVVQWLNGSFGLRFRTLPSIISADYYRPRASCMRVCTCTHTCHLYIQQVSVGGRNISTHIHTYIHTYMHTYIPSSHPASLLEGESSVPDPKGRPLLSPACMYVYVCMYVCVCVNMYVSVPHLKDRHLLSPACMYAYVCMYVCVCVNMYVSVHI